MKEIWRDIKNYEGLYQVSNFGRVRSYPNKFHKDFLIMSQVIINGYYSVGLSKNGKKKMRFVHRLIAETFIPNPDKLPQVSHKDENNFKTGDGCNNCVDNLEWCTAKENSNMPKHKQYCQKENNPFYGKHHSEETKKILSEKNKGKVVPQEIREKISNTLKYGGSYKAKPVYCDGKIFSCGKECAKYYGIKYSTMKSWLNGTNNTPLKWKEKGLHYIED